MSHLKAQIGTFFQQIFACQKTCHSYHILLDKEFEKHFLSVICRFDCSLYLLQTPFLPIYYIEISRISRL
jgi:hypothetical protein